MSLSINSFRAMAGVGNKTVEVSQNRPGTLKAGGFWSRLFGTAGKSAIQNQRVMDEFCRVIREKIGDRAGTQATEFLAAARSAGRPLKGFMIRKVFTLVDMPAKELAAQNASTLAFARKSIGNSLGADISWDPSAAGNRRNIAASKDPATRTLWKEINRFLDKTVSDATAQSQQVSTVSLKNSVAKILTPERLAATSAFCAAERNGISPAAMENLKPIILMSGVPEDAMGALADLAVFVKGKLGAMAETTDAIGMFSHVKEIRDTQGALFSGVEPGEATDPKSIFNYAVQCALALADTQPEQAAEMAGRVFTSAPVQELMGAINRGVEDKSALAGELHGMLTGMVSGFSARGPVDQKKMNSVLQRDGDSLNEKAASYLMGEGVLHYASPPAVDGFGMVFFGGNVTGDRILQLIDASGSKGVEGATRGANANFREYGRLAMNIYYDAAAAESPNETPPPQQFWQTVFHDGELPAGITRENLAAGIGQRMEELTTEAVNQLDDAEFDDPTDQFEKEALVMTASQGMSYGLDPRRAIAVRAENNAGARALERSDFQRLQSGRAPGGNPAAAVQEGVRLMALDLHRLTGECSITVGGDRVELKDVPDAANEDYLTSGVNNPIIKNITELVTNFCPDSAMQRATVFTMLGQASQLFMRVLGPIVNLVIDEHTGTHMSLTRPDNADGAVRLTLQSPKGAGYDVRAEYAIARDGSFQMTDLRLADHE